MTENNPYAGFWKRFAAFIIDALIVYVFIEIFRTFFEPLIMEPIIERTQQTATLHLSAMMGYIIVLPLLIVLYFVLFESSSKQATLGKQLLKIKVVDSQGEKISFLRSLGRTFGKILSAIPFLIGFIMAGPSQKKQALHDKIANTYVVNKDYKPGDPFPLLSKHLGCMVSLSVVVGLFITLTLLTILFGEKHVTKPSNDPNIEFQQALNRLYNLHMSKQENNLQYNSKRVKLHIGISSKYGIMQTGNYLYIIKDKDVRMMRVGYPELSFRIINNNQVCCEPHTENACDIIQGMEICPTK